MQLSNLKRFLPVLSLLACVAVDAFAADSMQNFQGQYWRWTAPPGWKHTESIAGVTLTSPDQRFTAALAGLMRSPGQATPQWFLATMLSKAYRNVRVGAIRPLPNRQMGYQTWQWIEADVTATAANGAPMQGVWKCGVANYYNLNDGLLVGFWSPPAELQKVRATLDHIASSIVLTDPNRAFGNNTLIQPKNNPNTAGDIIVESYNNKTKSNARSMQKWSDMTRGSEQTFDPATGKTYQTPFNAWDGTRGGYVNPQDTTQLLQCGTPQDPRPCR